MSGNEAYSILTAKRNFREIIPSIANPDSNI